MSQFNAAAPTTTQVCQTMAGSPSPESERPTGGELLLIDSFSKCRADPFASRSLLDMLLVSIARVGADGATMRASELVEGLRLRRGAESLGKQGRR